MPKNVRGAETLDGSDAGPMGEIGDVSTMVDLGSMDERCSVPSDERMPVVQWEGAFAQRSWPSSWTVTLVAPVSAP